MVRFERKNFGGKFGHRREVSGAPRPVKVGEEYDVEITETGSRGDGIARIKNFVVFVNGTKRGEKVHIKITDVRRRFAIGQKVESKTEDLETPIEVEEAEEVTEEVVKEAEEEE
ncbi:MAG: TRAM domain-containing protein [Candidatus Aenigmatarchaeota archaeon]